MAHCQRGRTVARCDREHTPEACSRTRCPVRAPSLGDRLGDASGHCGYARRPTRACVKTKGDKYREPPLSLNLHLTSKPTPTFAQSPMTRRSWTWRHAPSNRWIKNAAETCLGETDDVGWQFLTPHDLRRTWGHAPRRIPHRPRHDHGVGRLGGLGDVPRALSSVPTARDAAPATRKGGLAMTDDIQFRIDDCACTAASLFMEVSGGESSNAFPTQPP